jgi:hypothetical protein
MTGRAGGGARGAGAPRAGGAKKTAREAAPKCVEKKIAKTPVKAVKEKVAVAKVKAAQKASHDERREAYGLTEKSGDRTAEKEKSKEKRATRVLKE